MANRILRDWTTSENIDMLSAEAERFFTRLIMKADDFGCFHGNLKLLRAALFPLKNPTDKQIESWVKECAEVGAIQIYMVDGKRYVKIKDFGQRLRTMKSQFPQPDSNPPSIDSGPQTNDCLNRSEEEVETEEEIETELEGTAAPVGATQTVELRADEFMKKISAHVNEYPKEMLRRFYDYWTEMNDGGRKMRFEMQKVFDVKKRLNTWARNERASPKQYGKQNGITAEGTLDRLNNYSD